MMLLGYSRTDRYSIHTAGLWRSLQPHSVVVTDIVRIAPVLALRDRPCNSLIASFRPQIRARKVAILSARPIRCAEACPAQLPGNQR